MKKSINKLSAVVIVTVTAITILLVAYFAYMCTDIRFEGAPSELNVTKAMVVDVVARNMYDGKIGSSTTGYCLTTYSDGNRKSDIDFFSLCMIYGFLQDLEPIDTKLPESTNDTTEKFITFFFNTGNDRIAVDASKDGSVYVYLMSTRLSDGRISDEYLYSYFIDPDRLTRLINHFIARAEKLYPERYLPQSSK